MNDAGKILFLIIFSFFIVAQVAVDFILPPILSRAVIIPEIIFDFLLILAFGLGFIHGKAEDGERK